MCKMNVHPCLYKEISTLRAELERLLNTENLTSEAVLEISKKLDKYIAKYYILQRTC